MVLIQPTSLRERKRRKEEQRYLDTILYAGIFEDKKTQRENKISIVGRDKERMKSKVIRIVEQGGAHYTQAESIKTKKEKQVRVARGGLLGDGE
jgi:hypothetical protein